MRTTVLKALDKLLFSNKSNEQQKKLQTELETLRAKLGSSPPGHFYSPIPSKEEVLKDASRIFREKPRTIEGIELNEEEQMVLLEEFVPYYKEIPFQAQKSKGLRYYFENPAYSYSDGIMLYCMIRHLKPKRIIEVGSGYTSCLTLDTNDHFFDGKIKTTFIEPYPELLISLLRKSDLERVEIIPQRLQDVELSLFNQLQANDILFIDSTHVCKVGSDVNRIILEILPALKSGVHIHFHDIFYPFEYPMDWILKQGFFWSEAYLLKAFLLFNDEFKIVLMNTFMEYFHKEFFLEKMPLCMKNTGGNIWIKRI